MSGTEKLLKRRIYKRFKYIEEEKMIREMNINDRKNIDKMQFDLQKYFSEIDQTHESQSYKDIDDAHRYMQKMMDDVNNMDGQ